MPEPIQSEYRQQMNRLAEILDCHLNGTLPGPARKVAFVLIMAETGKIEGGRVNYISNGHRADMVAMLRELLARFEGRYAGEGVAGHA